MIGNVWFHTCGQPWLVNAIATEITEEILGSDAASVILPEYVGQAVGQIILRRDTHIDSLLERLREERVRKVIEPLITGESTGYDLLDDDYQYVRDLGLIRERKSDKRLAPANPVYAEVIIRGLSFRSRTEMDHRDYPPGAAAYLSAGNRLDMRRLLTDFQQFWREHSDIWIKRYEYKEAAPHLILTAFFQRVINAGGRISREFASGRGRLDMCLHYRERRYPVEIKIRYSAKRYEQGKEQLAEYMDTLGCDEGWLVVFDRRKSIPWKKRLFWKTEKSGKRKIHVAGC